MTVPPVRPVISTLAPVPLPMVPGKVIVPVPPSRSKAIPAAPVRSPLAAVNVPAPRPARLIPSLLLPVESTSSNSKLPGPVTSTAGPPVAEMLSVPNGLTVNVPVWVENNAAAAPDVVVNARSVPVPSPKVSAPVVAVRLTAPLLLLVTVMSSITLLVAEAGGGPGGVQGFGP